MTGFEEKSLSPLRGGFASSRAGALLLSTVFCFSGLCAGQVFTVEPDHVAGRVGNLANFKPTSVQLGQAPLTSRTREELIRIFQSEQAFAVRPLPLGTRGLTLHANGPLNPSGSAYVNELEKYGISSKPGDRLLISKFDIKPDRIVFEFNGGPEKHHHIMQHIQIGGGYNTVPLAQDDGETPVGSRFTLLFPKYVPEMNGAELRGLIAPILDFSLKTPVQAFADTLPPKLKSAVLDHEVLVGMNREMVIKAVGMPDQKVREMDGQMPFEEWIYGVPPHEVQFVRFNGNRVIRLEIADVGQKPVIRDKDETDGYFAGQFVHQVRMGDAAPVDTSKEHAPAPAPTLRQPGESLPDVVDKQGQLKPVQFPKDDPKPNPIPPPPGQDSSDQSLPGQNPSSQNPSQNPSLDPSNPGSANPSNTDPSNPNTGNPGRSRLPSSPTPPFGPSDPN